MIGELEVKPGNEIDTRRDFLISQFSNSVIENVNVWLNVLDQEMNIVYWNATAEKVSGYSRGEVLGHSKIWEWLYPDEQYRHQIESEVMAMLVLNKALENFETKILCKDGQVKTISWNSKSLLDNQGRVYGAITFGYDITERRKAREALQKAHNELSVLYEIASVASSSSDLDTILQRSLERVMEVMKTNKGMIHLLDAEAQKLQLAAQLGMSEAVVLQIKQLSVDGGLVGRVLCQGKPLMVPCLADELKNLESVPPHLLNSYLGVPMHAKGKVLGVFSLLGKAGRSFSAEEIALLSSISDQVGVAVEHTRLHHQEAQLAVREERQRLARDLHDSVTQSLYSLTLFAETGRRVLQRHDHEAAEWYLTRLCETAQEALKEMRLLVYELRPVVLERDGLIQTLQKRLDAVERRAGVKAHFIADALTELPHDVERDLYYVIQEALNNALKHAMAESVTVEISATGNRVCANIVDDGIGFDVHELGNGGGMGLANMKERVQKLGGLWNWTRPRGRERESPSCWI